MKRMIILLTLVASLIAVTSAAAITKSTAQRSARGWQHWACGEASGRHCVNWHLVSPTCTGPYIGRIQWLCEGFTLESTSHQTFWCKSETAWGAYNFLIHTYYDCHPGLQNLRVQSRV